MLEPAYLHLQFLELITWKKLNFSLLVVSYLPAFVGHIGTMGMG